MQALHLHVLQLLVLTLQTTSGLMASSAGTSIFSKMAAARSPPAVCLPRPRPAERHLLIDGNNLMAHRKVTKGREALAARLAGIRPARVTLVFDGKRGELPSESGSNPRVVVTSGGDEESGADRETADEWIERQLVHASRENQLEVVTADRALRRTTHAAKVKTIK